MRAAPLPAVYGGGDLPSPKAARQQRTGLLTPPCPAGPFERGRWNGCAQSSPGCLARACTSHARPRDAGDRPRFQRTQPSRGGQSEPSCQGGWPNALGQTQGPLPNKHRVSVSSTLWPPVPHRPAPSQGPFVSTAGCAAQAGGPTGERGEPGAYKSKNRGA